MNNHIRFFYHQDTNTLSYLVYDHIGGYAIIIDSVLDFDLHSGKISTVFADKQIAFIEEHKLKVDWILETHAHADHLSAANYLKSKLNAKTAVGAGIVKVQRQFKEVFNISDDELSADGKIFDHLLEDSETLTFGQLSCQVMATPGHTQDSVTYLIEDNAFIGDTLFMPDAGTARCDFPGGCAAQLYDSIQSIYQLPGQTKLWICHDYQPGGRSLANKTTVSESKSTNIHIKESTTKDSFIEERQQKDLELDMPKLLYPAVQVNIRGGRLPKAENNGRRFIKIPLDLDK